MLKSYEAIYDRGRLHWTRDKPPDSRMRVIVTVIEEEIEALEATQRKALLDQARGSVTPRRTKAEIDRDISEMRSEWRRD